MEEQGHAEERAGQATRESVSLLDLPDELLDNVFQQLLDYSAHYQYPASSVLLPLYYTLLNQRIFAVLKPLRFRHITTSTDLNALDELVAKLMFA
ncbi:hypothetical protein JCM11641_001943 [Rhodosporidiobolus odoratus]